MTIFRIFIATLVILLGIPAGLAAGGEPVSFSWAFFLKPEGGQVKSLDFAAPESVVDGERLRIYLELDEHSFVYLYLYDSKNDLYLVFPPSGSFYNGDFPVGYRAYIPSGHEWFMLDDAKGTERFYLLASNKRLLDLEKLTDRFMVSGDRGLKGQLLAELSKATEKSSTAPAYEIDLVKVSHGSRLSFSKPLRDVNAHKVSATGGYGAVLDMVNR